MGCGPVARVRFPARHLRRPPDRERRSDYGVASSAYLGQPTASVVLSKLSPKVSAHVRPQMSTASGATCQQSHTDRSTTAASPRPRGARSAPAISVRTYAGRIAWPFGTRHRNCSQLTRNPVPGRVFARGRGRARNAADPARGYSRDEFGNLDAQGLRGFGILSRPADGVRFRCTPGPGPGGVPRSRGRRSSPGAARDGG